MARQDTSSLRRAGLCDLLRKTGFCYIDGTASVSGSAAVSKVDTVALRHELDCLITLYEEGHIDPVKALGNAGMRPSDPAPLHGGQ